MAGEFIDDFFESLHNDEAERRFKNDSTDGFLLAIGTVLGGMTLHYVNILPIPPSDWIQWIFIGLAGLFATLWSAAVVCIVASVYPRDYGYLSNPQKLGDFAAETEAYYKYHQPGDAGDAECEKDFRRFVRRQYIECAKVNRASNQKRQKWQAYAKNLSIYAIAIAGINAAPTFYVQRTRDDVTKVEIVDSKSREAVESESTNRTAPAEGRTPADQVSGKERQVMSNDPKSHGTHVSKPVTPPAKPVEPKIDVFREDKNPPKSNGGQKL